MIITSFFNSRLHDYLVELNVISLVGVVIFIMWMLAKIKRGLVFIVPSIFLIITILFFVLTIPLIQEWTPYTTLFFGVMGIAGFIGSIFLFSVAFIIFNAAKKKDMPIYNNFNFKSK